ncbi:hypothetical protein L2E82_36270 [Cichorium intybus]|uniref:Uncharacterized protein n=1 Tax=Cichorium intybus TaxID=13427 RepID=A0ACB9BR31_CICIN|nr:hypothetical protein L2E82_36270 [Cichorium intybus]
MPFTHWPLLQRLPVLFSPISGNRVSVGYCKLVHYVQCRHLPDWSNKIEQEILNNPHLDVQLQISEEICEEAEFLSTIITHSIYNLPSISSITDPSLSLNLNSKTTPHNLTVLPPHPRTGRLGHETVFPHFPLLFLIFPMFSRILLPSAVINLIQKSRIVVIAFKLPSLPRSLM